MDTEDIMRIALNMAGFDEVPADSEIYVPGRDIERVLVGVDVSAGEVHIAKQYGYDAVVAHHPAGGRARVEGWRLFEKHVQQMVDAGVPEEEARRAIRSKMSSLEIAAHSANYEQVPAAARLLGIPFLNIHNPLDEVGRRRIATALTQRLLAEEPRVSDVLSVLRSVPEFHNAATAVAVRLGAESNPVGRWVFSHAAYTNGGYEVAKAYFQHGIGTLIYIHIAESDIAKLREDGAGNLIVTGHLASDSVGINPFIEELRRRGLTVDTSGGIVTP